MLKALFAVVLIIGMAIFFTTSVIAIELSRIETLLRDIEEHKVGKTS